MNPQVVPPRLGRHVLIVVDAAPCFVDCFRKIALTLTELDQRNYTLIRCCPPVYWEHGGGDDADCGDEIKSMWEQEEAEFARTKEYLGKVKATLIALGVPPDQIETRTATEQSSMVEATMAELRNGHYTGVIVSGMHAEIVNRLEHRGVIDRLRKIPEVEVLEMRSEPAVQTM
jgi:hypothetical protein